ncbi:MAG: iron-containing alcohol dehydrogenase, partial [Atribacterota bacterium]|nr:iron-containing alcohol dehydrogenase [Atribacterota bacterium]
MDDIEYYFNFPQRIINKWRVINKIGIILKSYDFNKIMIVTDKGIAKSGLIPDVEQSLKENNIKYTIFSEVKSNPDINTVNIGKKLAQKDNIDCLLGIGGGSCIDAAKAIAIVLTNDASIEKYEGLDKYENNPLPIIAVPTTAGTGSESTPSAVITDSIRKNKMSIFSIRGLPILAILDPSVLKSLSANLAAATGLDALCHAIESYTSLKSTYLTDSISLKAIELIGKY